MAKYTQKELQRFDFEKEGKDSLYIGNYLYLVWRKKEKKKVFQFRFNDRKKKTTFKRVIGELKKDKHDVSGISLKEAMEKAKMMTALYKEDKIDEIDKIAGIYKKKEFNEERIFSKLFIDYMKNFRSKKVAAKTAKMEMYYFTDYLKPLHNKDVKLIRKSDISKLFLRIQQKSLNKKTNTKVKEGYNSYDTVMRVKTTLNQFFNYLVNKGILDDNIVKDIKLDSLLPTKKVKKKKDIETDLEKLKEYYLKIRFYHKSLTGFQRRNFQVASKYLTEFMFLTAMRNSQARLTKWEYIDFDKNIIVYPADIVKKRREYILPMTKRIRIILKTLQKLNTINSEYVFFNKRTGKNLTDIAVSRVLQNATNNKITSHNFRDILLTLIKIHYKHDFNKIVLVHQILDHSKFINEIDDVYTQKDANELIKMRREILEWWYSTIYPQKYHSGITRFDF